MGDDLRDRAWEVFERLSDLPDADRIAALDAACGDAPELRREVERLLALDRRLGADETDAGFLKSPIVRPGDGLTTQPFGATGPARDARLPGRIGPYRIVRLLGEGGMGAVFEAEQERPKRSVALKVIRPGLVSTGLLRRFAQEVEILGRLQHPGIARIYEAGVAEDGQPFFAMEFIRGLPLDQYAGNRSLPLDARLELVARVCDAVQHAHDRGVIHRDLKPANILVEATGDPKILDFGVARATVDRMSWSGLTQTGQFLGTPSYMSPEQVSADPDAIDHRTDVYALGVILFELTADRLPYRVEGRPLAEAARIILEEEPPSLGSVHPELRGDVETIVAKALDKDPARRYQAAADLAADLRRWLANEPIRARPPSALYQLRKFTRRHKALVVGAAATLVTLVLGLVGTSLFAAREAYQRTEAERSAREALFQGYRARIAAAAAAIAANDSESAALHLDASPRDLRDWEWRYLKSRLDDSVSVLDLREGQDRLLLVSPDRLRLLSNPSGRVEIADVESGETRSLAIGSMRLIAARLTTAGLRIATWLDNANLEIHDGEGRLVCRVKTPPELPPTFVAIHPDGTRFARLVFGKHPVGVAIHDAADGRQVASFDAHGGGIWSIGYSADGTRIATGGDDNLAKVWDASTGRLLATCRGHQSKVLSVAFRPDGRRLVTTSADGTVRQWDAGTGAEVEPPYERHSGEVVVATYSPDGLRIASGGTDRAIRVWRARGRQDESVLLGHTGSVTALDFTADGRRLVSRSEAASFGWTCDNTLRIWRVSPDASYPILRGHTSYVYPIAFRPDGRQFASGSWDGTIFLRDTRTLAVRAVLKHPGSVPALAYAPSADWLASGDHEDRSLRIWDTATGQLLRRLPGPDVGMFRVVIVSPDGTRVVGSYAVGEQETWYALDAMSGERLASGAGAAIAFSPDGRFMAVRENDDRVVSLHDGRSFERLRRLEGHELRVFSATFRWDSRILATCSRDRTVRLWDLVDGTCRTIRGHTDQVFTAAFHPDGTRLATAGRDRNIWLWDLARGEEVARLPGHSSYVWSIAFSPDGRTLLSGSGDFTVRVWDTQPLRDRINVSRPAALTDARPE